eukprot:1149773-Pelagomonas_calceolata.AAC.1
MARLVRYVRVLQRVGMELLCKLGRHLRGMGSIERKKDYACQVRPRGLSIESPTHVSRRIVWMQTCTKKVKARKRVKRETNITPHFKEKRTRYLGLRHRAFPPPSGKEKSVGTRRVMSSTLCLIFVMRTERSLLKSASGANKLFGVLDRMIISFRASLMVI